LQEGHVWGDGIEKARTLNSLPSSFTVRTQMTIMLTEMQTEKVRLMGLQVKVRILLGTGLEDNIVTP
jgi:hypothetical protein